MDEKNETGPAVEPKQEQQCKQARPHDELICELLDSRRPKTEREHAAVREIERLRHDIERHVEIACELATENERLRAELTEAKEALRLCVDVVQHISYAWQGQGTHPQTAIKAALAAMEESICSVWVFDTL